jgi:hypothetical protein
MLKKKISDKCYIKKTKDTLEVEIIVAMSREEEYYVLYSEELGLSSYATTLEKAKSRFETELLIFFEETTKKGTLEKYLLQKGWTLTQKPIPSYKPPEYQAISNFGLEGLNKTNSYTEKIAIPI